MCDSAHSAPCLGFFKVATRGAIIAKRVSLQACTANFAVLLFVLRHSAVRISRRSACNLFKKEPLFCISFDLSIDLCVSQRIAQRIAQGIALVFSFSSFLLLLFGILLQQHTFSLTTDTRHFTHPTAENMYVNAVQSRHAGVGFGCELSL